MRWKIILATLALTTLGPSFAAAHDHCEGWEIIETKELYFVRGTTAEHDGYFYVYMESNGIAGLQRGGSSLAGEQDHCQQDAPWDTLLL